MYVHVKICTTNQVLFLHCRVVFVRSMRLVQLLFLYSLSYSTSIQGTHGNGSNMSTTEENAVSSISPHEPADVLNNTSAVPEASSLIVPIVVPVTVIIVLLLVGFTVFYFYRRKAKKNKRDKPSTETAAKLSETESPTTNQDQSESPQKPSPVHAETVPEKDIEAVAGSQRFNVRVDPKPYAAKIDHDIRTDDIFDKIDTTTFAPTSEMPTSESELQLLSKKDEHEKDLQSLTLLI